MSFNRKNWSALSSLARQWSAEDEEEQERERRRRHRQLNSTTEAKEETSSVVQNMTSRASNRFRSSSEVKPSRLGSSKPGNERALVEATNQQEDRGVRRRVEMLNNVKQDKKETLNARKLEKEAAERKAKPPSEPPQKQKEPIVEKCESLVHPKEPDEEKHQIVGEGKKEKTVEKHENLDQSEKDPKTHKDLVFSEEQQVPKAPQPQGVAAVQNEVATQQPQRASWERKSISRLEVKIQSRVRNFPEGAPATVGPQVVPRKEKQEDTLSRSVSMRLPANTAKLEEKLERYTSAVQRAGSIKLPPSARRNFHPPSEGVASKRSIFEATVPIRAETTTPVRKESLKISGGVTSRINLWIRRTQEPSKDEGTKDIHKIENIAERTQLGKWPDDS
ncbi:ladinin-1 isoform X3 [Rhineura floridana]|uniref:ladinin-1 isoform X3 n=1 Tax=Rhineura floridana TaxID=261503 RepID=UPI002AC806C7|nr:ladinin-1 isoform X3 [Rhineura floridana]